MNASAPDTPNLSGWTVVTLRSARQNAALRRPVTATGAALLGLPALQLLPAADPPAARGALDAALDSPLCIFTSPQAVRFARALRSLRDFPGLALAVGSGTAAALRRAGLAQVESPKSGMHSEGLLALPVLAQPPATVGLVTAPGGRGMIADTLQDRGATLRIAHVYRRSAGRLDRRHAAALLETGERLALLLSSGEALGHATAQLPEDAASRLRSALVVAASERLLELAGRSGFRRRALAPSPRLADLLETVARYANGSPFR